jgi:hypothetical protein
VCDREAGDLAAAVDAVIAAGGRSIAFSPGPHVTDVGITDGNIGDVFANALVGAALCPC